MKEWMKNDETLNEKWMNDWMKKMKHWMKNEWTIEWKRIKHWMKKNET